jgi:hypothetical protein
MSDVWDEYPVLTSIDADGKLTKTVLPHQRSETCDWAIDANDAAFERYRAAQYQFHLHDNTAKATYDAVNPAVVGRVVKVVRGRKDKGAIGKVIVVLERPYRMGFRSVMGKKLGVATSPRMVTVTGKYGKTFQNYADMIWVWAQNCELERPLPVDLDMCRRDAQTFAGIDMGTLVQQSIREIVDETKRNVA